MHQSRTLGRTRPSVTFEQIIGNRAAFEFVLEQVGQVALRESAVFIGRETDTGKDLLLTQGCFYRRDCAEIERFEVVDKRTLFWGDMNAQGYPQFISCR
jgi:transcriptional regulator of aromatic amino acid metabolism